MITRGPRLDAFEAEYQRQANADVSAEEALRRFAALWAHARAVRPDLGADWRQDIAVDIRVARVLNGLGPDHRVP